MLIDVWSYNTLLPEYLQFYATQVIVKQEMSKKTVFYHNKLEIYIC